MKALRTGRGEMVDRMRRMRKSVKEHNIYWWAGSFIGELCELRLKGSKGQIGNGAYCAFWAK
jgi:trehalose 6-phosphate synthase